MERKDQLNFMFLISSRFEQSELENSDRSRITGSVVDYKIDEEWRRKVLQKTMNKGYSYSPKRG